MTDPLAVLLKAVMAGQYAYAAVLALIALITLVRKYGSAKVPFLATDAGGLLLSLALSFLGTLGLGLASGVPLTLALLKKALLVWGASSFSYSTLRRLLLPIVEKFAPAWLQSLLRYALWVLDKPASAGDAAVTAKPALGTVSYLGTPKDVP